MNVKMFQKKFLQIEIRTKLVNFITKLVNFNFIWMLFLDRIYHVIFHLLLDKTVRGQHNLYQKVV